jgi:hypothetical protein
MIRPPQKGPTASAATEAITTIEAVATALIRSAVQNAIKSIRARGLHAARAALAKRWE